MTKADLRSILMTVSAAQLVVDEKENEVTKAKEAMQDGLRAWFLAVGSQKSKLADGREFYVSERKRVRGKKGEEGRTLAQSRYEIRFRNEAPAILDLLSDDENEAQAAE